MCKQRPLQFTWALQARSDLQGSCLQAFMFTFFAGVPCGRNARAQTPKKAKRKLTVGFVVVLAYFWQRSEAGVHTVFTNPTSQMIWFLASVGLLLVGCCCCFCCCCAVLFCCWWLAAASCCWFAGAGWLLLLVSYCWLAAAGLVLPAVWLLLVCCCRLAAAVWPLLVGCCWLPSAAVGLLVLFCCWLAACCCLLLPLPLPALQSLLICCWLLLHKPYHCGNVVNWAWKAWFWLRWPVW